MADLSPMMQQYFDIKEQHKDQILFFRLGDFYEMFYEDAILASKELELTLTGRDCGQEERAPMCGVPYHSSEAYIARLIEKGYKVAICEQMEDPALAKGLVTRDVIRVVTPGTVIENSMLADDKNNYIASLYLQKEDAGVCIADISTGTAHVTHLAGKGLARQMIDELCRFMPSEVLFNSSLLSLKEVTSYIKTQLDCAAELMDDEEYTQSKIEETLALQFPEGVGKAAEAPADRAALSALVCYLKQTQKKGIERLKTVLYYENSQFMRLSSVTRANLELCETMRGREKRGTLLWVLDNTQTAMGKRLLRGYLEQPLLDSAQINRRLGAVAELCEKEVDRAELKHTLSGIFDMERLMTRVVYGSALPREVYSLGYACQQLPAVKSFLQNTTSEALRQLYLSCDELTDVKELIFAAVNEDPPVNLKDGGVIRPGYHPEVDELRQIVTGGRGMLAGMETKLKEETGIKSLKIGYNKVFGYYIEVTKSYLSQVPNTFIRKQTLTNAERYITEELKNYENKILGANERLVVLERELFDDLLRRLAANLDRIQSTASTIATLDVLASFAQAAVKNNYVRPVVNEGDLIEIREGRHPVVEQMVKGGLFVPNDTCCDTGDNRMLIITGPNMAGKSTYMRQTALITLMAQIGSFVPAKSATVGVVDSIFTRVGAQDDLSSGKSTFMVEMTEVAEILQNAGPKSLIILDEIGRGTSTFDGMSIARAVVEHIAQPENGICCKTLFATHYHELTSLEDEVAGVKNFNIAVKKRGDDITFLRRIVRGPADDSYGIQVAKLAGVPDAVIRRAKAVLKELEETAALASGGAQLNFGTVSMPEEMEISGEIKELLQRTDVETLTPLEALNLLFRIKQML